MLMWLCPFCQGKKPQTMVKRCEKRIFHRDGIGILDAMGYQQDETKLLFSSRQAGSLRLDPSSTASFGPRA
jgi:hypothetical protein